MFIIFQNHQNEFIYTVIFTFNSNIIKIRIKILKYGGRL